MGLPTGSDRVQTACDRYASPPMATDKRERQRQNRAVKQEERSKQQRRQKIIDLSKRIAIWAVVFFALLILANIVWG